MSATEVAGTAIRAASEVWQLKAVSTDIIQSIITMIILPITSNTNGALVLALRYLPDNAAVHNDRIQRREDGAGDEAVEVAEII